MENQELMNRAQYWSPSKLPTISSGNSDTIEFAGLSAHPYAWNRMNVSAATPANLNEIKATAKMNDGRTTLFEDVHLLAIKRLFELRSLKGGILIPNNKKLRLTLKNDSASAQTIGVDLNGYDDPHYQAKLKQYQSAGQAAPEPVFVWATVDVAAGADGQRITLNTPSEDLELHRIAISSENDDDLQVSFEVDNVDLIPKRFVSQINDQFKDMDIIRPFAIPQNLPFYAYATNLNNANTREISILCECYKI